VSIVYKIIAWSFIYINKFAIYKSAKCIEIYIEFLTLNTINNKLRKKELRELRNIN